MILDSPNEKKTARAAVSWLVNQTKKFADEEVLLVARWHGQSPDTLATLKEIREDRSILLVGKTGRFPGSFEVRKVTDLGGRFRGAKTFVEDAVKILPEFYANAGQHLRAFVPKPPKLIEAKAVEVDTVAVPKRDASLALPNAKRERPAWALSNPLSRVFGRE